MINLFKQKTFKIETIRPEQLDYVNKQGFYLIISPNEKIGINKKTLCSIYKCQVSLVKFYEFTEESTKVKGIGFGVWDGGGFLPLKDIRLNSLFIDITNNKFNKLIKFIGKQLIEDIAIEYPPDITDPKGTIVVHKN